MANGKGGKPAVFFLYSIFSCIERSNKGE
jgi:hypothetical protein